MTVIVRRITRRSVAALAVLLVAMLLAGCVEVQMDSEFNEDGSARHAFEATIDRDGLDQLGSFGGEAVESFDPEDGREQAEAAGFDYTPIDTDDEVGSRIAKTFDDGEQVGAAFDEMFSAGADQGAEVPLGAVTGTFVKDGDEYRLNLTIDSDLLFSSSGVEDTDSAEDLGFGDLSSFIDITYTATMPGEISETNGTDLGDGKVKWDLPLTGKSEISAVSKEGSSGSGATIAIVGLVALLLVGGLVAGYLFTRRRTTAPTTSAGSFTAPQTAAPAGSFGTTPPPFEQADSSDERPSHEQDTTKLPPE